MLNKLLGDITCVCLIELAMSVYAFRTVFKVGITKNVIRV